MKIPDVRRACRAAAESQEWAVSWDGDNRKYVLEVILPVLQLSPYDKQILRWAYSEGYELISDGETVVNDLFLGGVIKSPAGVGHDYINRTPGHITPDGHIWTPSEANALYYRVMKALGYPLSVRIRRWLGVTVSIRQWWIGGNE